jgi:hypothetical protein
MSGRLLFNATWTFAAISNTTDPWKIQINWFNKNYFHTLLLYYLFWNKSALEMSNILLPVLTSFICSSFICLSTNWYPSR